jgi:hypothetical protein
MAAETFRIEIPINVKDNTEPGVSQATRKMNGFDRSNQKTQKRLEQMNRTRYQVILDALDRASNVIGRVSARVRGIAGKTFRFTLRAVDMVTKPFRSILSGINSALGLVGAGIGVAGGIVLPLKLTIEQQNVETAFEVLLGSAEAARKRVDELTTFAGETPFERSEIYEASRVLQVFTGNALSTGEGLRMVGDIAAGTQQQFGDVALWMGRLYDAMKAGRPVGEMTSRLQEMGAISGDARNRLEQLAASGQDISKTWPKATEEFRRFDGIMEKLSGNLANLLLGVKSFFTNNIIKRWGAGLTTAITPALESFRQWRKEHPEEIAQMGDKIERTASRFAGYFVDKVQGMARSLRELYNDPAFQNANLTGKLRIAWHQVIAEPFGEWWDSTGRAWLADKASKMGEGIGAGITVGLLALLGIDISSAARDGENIGGAFIQGFKDGFDTEEITKALKEWASNNKEIVFGLGVIIGGKLVAGIISKLVELNKLFGKGGMPGGAQFPSTYSTATMTVTAQAVHVYGKAMQSPGGGVPGGTPPVVIPPGGKLPKLPGKTLPKLPSGKGSTKGAANILNLMRLPNGKYVTSGAIGKVAGKAALPLAVGLEAYGIYRSNDKVRTTAGAGGGLAGAALGAKGGAAVGTLILPGIGTIVGGALGGLGGYMFGNYLGGKAVDAARGGGAKPAYASTASAGGGGEGTAEYLNQEVYEPFRSIVNRSESWGRNLIVNFMAGRDSAGMSMTGWLNSQVYEPFRTIVNRSESWGRNLMGNFMGGRDSTGMSMGGWLDSQVYEPFRSIVNRAEPWGRNMIGNFMRGRDSAGMSMGGWLNSQVYEPFRTIVNRSESWGRNLMGNFMGGRDSTGMSMGGWLDSQVYEPFRSIVNRAEPWGRNMIGNFMRGRDSAGMSMGGWLNSQVYEPFRSIVVRAEPWGRNMMKNFVKGMQQVSVPAPRVPAPVYSSTPRRTGNMRMYATGGILTRPHLGMVAEAGPEAIIPLGQNRRARGIGLWQKAGEMLGMQSYGDVPGQLPNRVPTAVPTAGRDGQGINIKVEVKAEPKFTIEGDEADESKILEILKAYIREMTDDIGDELAERLARIFANMPVKGVV